MNFNLLDVHPNKRNIFKVNTLRVANFKKIWFNL